MRFDKLPKAVIQPDDPKVVRQAIRLLDDAGNDTRRPPGTIQLKLDERTSYYPTTGRFFVDGETHRRTERGIDALKDWIKRRPLEWVLDE